MMVIGGAMKGKHDDHVIVRAIGLWLSSKIDIPKVKQKRNVVSSVINTDGM